MDEQELVESAKRGDSAAFAMLFHNNYSFLVKYLMKLTMSPELSEDIAQDTMVKCMEKIKLYNGKSKFSSWLISIATNLYIDYTRKKKREKSWFEQAFRKMKWQVESRNEEWNDALTALSHLPDTVRIPIILKHYYGYEYEEIAQMLHIPQGTVKSRVHNGLASVRKELKADEQQEKRVPAK
ncbi:RNA polymerase sigma factor SigY [Bacillus sp. HMF5848]|uniref:RNA polymerase sigma factor SigY n=1 Tax=Bacillus sp. HMF5848 TaxID=2495421 RepID=UPI000F7B07C3|nr:RNA polymerase sigma factor SigY [Bacillus sp. HMF5848]RSK28693.1 RNA polymerase sigma factor SigY [Bacillus sp. HMF5848]